MCCERWMYGGSESCECNSQRPYEETYRTGECSSTFDIFCLLRMQVVWSFGLGERERAKRCLGCLFTAFLCQIKLSTSEVPLTDLFYLQPNSLSVHLQPRRLQNIGWYELTQPAFWKHAGLQSPTSPKTCYSSELKIAAIRLLTRRSVFIMPNSRV